MKKNPEKDRRSSAGGAHTHPAMEDVNQQRKCTTLTDAEADWSGREVVGNHTYILNYKIGQGGFGSVYLATRKDAAEDVFPDRFAVKLFHFSSISTPEKFLRRELSALRALDSRYIPRVHDFSLTDFLPWVAMDYYPGGSLQSHLIRHGALDNDRTWTLLANLLDALTVAHRASLLHLDVKPGNVLVSDSDEFVLSDFGISQAHFIPQGSIPLGMGAALYQSPEQKRADGVRFDVRTDLWGVGITAWAACSGISPIRMWDFLQKPTSLYGLEFLSSVKVDVDLELEEVIMDLLRNSQRKRPASAAEVRARVARHCETTAVDVPADPRKERGASPGRSNCIIKELYDPLWSVVAQTPVMRRSLVEYADGEILCREGEASYYAFILLAGKIEVEKNGTRLATELREGAFLGEITTLTGRRRTATLRASGPICVAVLSSAELEGLITQYPAVSIRLIKTIADRMSRMHGQE